MKKLKAKKEVTDKRIAQFVGVTPKTLQNWKRIPPNSEDFPINGRHNLYKGARISFYLLSKDDQQEDEVTATKSSLDVISHNNKKLIEALKKDRIEIAELLKLLKEQEEHIHQIKDIVTVLGHLGIFSHLE